MNQPSIVRVSLPFVFPVIVELAVGDLCPLVLTRVHRPDQRLPPAYRHPTMVVIVCRRLWLP